MIGRANFFRNTQAQSSIKTTDSFSDGDGKSTTDQPLHLKENLVFSNRALICPVLMKTVQLIPSLVGKRLDISAMFAVRTGRTTVGF